MPRNSTHFTTEVHAYASRGGAHGVCDDAAYQHIETLARLLSQDLMATSRHYAQHAWGGIFSQSHKYDYHQVKSRFIFDRVCPRARHIKHACEVGFMAGHTAMLLAEAAPQAKVLSFDLGHIGLVPWLPTQTARLKRAYGDRWLGVVTGSSLETLPRWKQDHPDFRCDVVFVDGGKTTHIRATDFANFGQLSHARTLVFFDEVTSEACANGTTTEDECYYLGRHKIRDRTTAKTAAGANRASRQGILKVRHCQWPPGWEGMDGICVAKFTKAITGL